MSSPPATVPGTRSTVVTLTAITLRRLRRGKALWVGIVIAAVQMVYAAIARPYRELASADHLFLSSMLVLALVPAMFVAASIGEDLDDRTATYLWSRPIARWTVLAGKLCALTPIVIVLIVGSWMAAVLLATGEPAPVASCLALAAGTTATSLVAAGIATIMPRHGMAMTIGYMLVDLFVGEMPFSLAELAITHQTNALAGLHGGPATVATPLVAMAAVSGLWAAVAVVRIRRLEV